MFPRIIFIFSTFLALFFCFIAPISSLAQDTRNTNPSSLPPDPPPPPEDDPPSENDGGEAPPEPPEPPEKEEDKCCEKEDPTDAEDTESTPPNPSSVKISFPLESFPTVSAALEGGLRLYFDTPEDNMGDPIFLEYQSVVGAMISAQVTSDLPAGVEKRFEIELGAGKPVAFDFIPGNAVLRPTASAAKSNARAQLMTESGEVTSDLATATKIRLNRPSGGYMEFDIADGRIRNWLGGTGRKLNFPADPSQIANATGVDVIKDSNGKIRQVKSPAGLLDVVPDSDDRGYRVITYLPSQVGEVSGDFYTLIANAKPLKTVHITHPIGTSHLVATFTDHSVDSTQDRIKILTYKYHDTFDRGHEWDLETKVDGITLLRTRRVIPDADIVNQQRIVRTVTDHTGKILFQRDVVQKYEPSWDGWTNLKFIDKPSGDSNLQKVQTYRYGSDPAKSDFRKLNWQMKDNGSIYEFKYDAEGRMIERTSPWLDGADDKRIIERYDYVPHALNEVVLPGDSRPRTTTVEVGLPDSTGNPLISKAFFAAFDDATNGGSQTLINEDAATPNANFGDPANRRSVSIFYPAGTTDASGRLKETIDELGLKTLYTYAPRTGGGLFETKSGPYDPSGATKSGVTRRSIMEKDGNNRLLNTTEAIFDGNTFVDYLKETSIYTPQGRLERLESTDLITNRVSVNAIYQWRGSTMVSSSSSDGTVMQNQYDGFDRQTATINGAIPSANSPIGDIVYPARPAITNTVTGEFMADLDGAKWGNRTETTTAGQLSLLQSIESDARGRVISATNPDGYTSFTEYTENETQTTTTRPDGSTVVSINHLDGRTKEQYGTGIVAQFYSYEVNANGGITTTVHTAEPDSPRHESSTVDMLGRLVSREISGHDGNVITTTNYLAGASLPLSVVSSAPNVPLQFNVYDSFGTLVRSGATVRPSASALDTASEQDRIQESEVSVLNDSSGLWIVTKKFIYPHEGAEASTRFLLGESRTKIAGFDGDEVEHSYQIDSLGNWRETISEERQAELLRIERTKSSAYQGEGVEVYHGGQLVESRAPGDTTSTFQTYDALGRLVESKLPRHTNASSVIYVQNGNQILTSTDSNGATTSFDYYPTGTAGAGKMASITLDDGTVRRMAYDSRGNLIRQWGSASAPNEYSYDSYNQLATLTTRRVEIPQDSTTWPSMLGAADVTTWIREEATGLLLQKLYADNKGTTYDYDIAGRMTMRSWERGVDTLFSYTPWGELDITDYSDATPDSNSDYDRMGRMTTQTNGIASTNYAYDANLRLDAETITIDADGNGPLPSLTRILDRSTDTLGRQSGTAILAVPGGAAEHFKNYAYDVSGRMSTVTSPAGTFSYSYENNANLLSGVTGPVHTVTNSWEPNRDILASKENKILSTNTVVSRYDYTVNAINQRTSVQTSGTAFASQPANWLWEYDTLGQVVKADSPTADHDRSYLYDVSGNRKKSADSITLPTSDNYSTNALNQYSLISVPTEQSVVPSYDHDGNATAYPLPVAPGNNATLVYDGENRLISATTGAAVVIYTYDSQSRRISRTQGANTTYYLYDGWNCIAEYTIQNSTFKIQNSFTWGPDLSGSLQGAGGVGGLLATTKHLVSGYQNHYFPTNDGNGNVSEYLNATSSIVAHYEYDPFGQVVKANGPEAISFSYRFSTKPVDVATGLYYYGYRWYDPDTGRWINRDPIGENGGLNLYGFVGNNGVNWRDYLGLEWNPVDKTSGGKIPSGNRPPPPSYTPPQPPKPPSPPPFQPPPVFGPELTDVNHGAAKVDDIAGPAGNRPTMYMGVISELAMWMDLKKRSDTAKAEGQNVGSIKLSCDMAWNNLKVNHPRYFKNNCPACCVYSYVLGKQTPVALSDGRTYFIRNRNNFEFLGFELENCKTVLANRPQNLKQMWTAPGSGAEYIEEGFDYGRSR